MHKLSILKITGLFFKQSLGRNFAGVNLDLVQNPEWAKSRMEKIQNEQDPESNQLQRLRKSGLLIQYSLLAYTVSTNKHK